MRDSALRIIVADDSAIVRDGLSRVLSDRGMTVVAVAADADALLVETERLQPDVAVVDVRMPPRFTDEGLRAGLTIRQRWPNVSVLFLSQQVYVTATLRLLAVDPSGIGYLLKDRVTDLDRFVDAIRVVAAGESVLDADIVRALVQRHVADRATSADPLSAREEEVLGLIAEGRTNGAIAAQLSISAGTVEKHCAAIFTKLGLQPNPDEHRRVLAVLAYLGGAIVRR